MARKLIVEVVGDSKSYERALGRSEKATTKFGQAMGQTSPRVSKLNSVMSTTGFSAVGLAGAVGGLAVVMGAKSVQAASDLNEQISRTQVVLGKAADETIAWSETTATSMGISQRAALAATGTFAGLFQTVGVAQADAGELSRTLVQLAADLASLQNSSPEEALIALRSGLADEAEPLRRFNIFLTEARVQQQALADTGKKTTAALTQQEKTLARYELIMKDSTLAQGNFALTSTGLANQQRILAAQVDDLSTKLGSGLVPMVTAVVGALNDLVTAGEDAVDVLGKLADLPGIEIPVNLVGGITAGRGGDILRHIVLGQISPLALGITIGKEVVDGIRAGMAGAATTEGLGLTGDEGMRGAPLPVTRGDIAAQAAANRKAGQAAIDSITAQVARQDDLNKQLRDSETRAAHLRELILKDPTPKLQARLRAELEKQRRLRQQIAAAAKSEAAATASAAASAQAAAEAAAAERKERERAAALARAEAVKAAQFMAIGLTPEGLTPTPGGGALLRRALSLQEQIKGTALDTDKTRTQLRKIVAFLKKHLKTAKQEVRAAILDMLNGISDALKGDGGSDRQGPLTAAHGIRSAQIIKNLGLSVEQADEIQRRLARATTGSNVIGRAAGGGGGSSSNINPQGGIFLESHTTIRLDGKVVANVVTRQQQKDRRRNKRQKRGQHRN